MITFYPMSTIVNDPFNLLSATDNLFLKDALSPDKVETIFQEEFPDIVENKTLSQIQVIRYKPQKRCLIEYRFEGNNQISLLGKIRFKGTDKNSYDLQQFLWNNGFDDQSVDNISVPEPIGLIPQWKMWLQRRVPGVTTTPLFVKPDGIKLAKQIAHVAHKLHQITPKTKRHHTINDELAILHQKLPLVIQLYPHWEKRIDQILQQCARLGNQLSYLTPVGIHRDFYADQLIIDGSRLYLLDLDLYCYGDPSLDIGNFTAHLIEYSLRVLGDYQALKDRELALENEFIQLTENATLERIIIYKILTLVRHIYLSTQFRDRRPYTEPLLQLCEHQLELS